MADSTKQKPPEGFDDNPEWTVDDFLKAVPHNVWMAREAGAARLEEAAARLRAEADKLDRQAKRLRSGE